MHGTGDQKTSRENDRRPSRVGAFERFVSCLKICTAYRSTAVQRFCTTSFHFRFHRSYGVGETSYFNFLAKTLGYSFGANCFQIFAVILVYDKSTHIGRFLRVPARVSFVRQFQRVSPLQRRAAMFTERQHTVSRRNSWNPLRSRKLPINLLGRTSVSNFLVKIYLAHVDL